MYSRSTISKSIAVCLLGMLAAAPALHAEVDPSVLKLAKKMTDIRKVDSKGREVSMKERMKMAERQGLWMDGFAKFAPYAKIQQDDSSNRILCAQPMLYEKEVIFEGGPKSEIQLVHIEVDEDEGVVNAEEVTKITEKAGVYILFTPEVIYMFDYENVNPNTGEKSPLYRKYENRE